VVAHIGFLHRSLKIEVDWKIYLHHENCYNYKYHNSRLHNTKKVYLIFWLLLFKFNPTVHGIRKSKHICSDLLSHRGTESKCTFLCLHSGPSNPVHLCMILFFFLYRFRKYQNICSMFSMVAILLTAKFKEIYVLRKLCCSYSSGFVFETLIWNIVFLTNLLTLNATGLFGLADLGRFGMSHFVMSRFGVSHFGLVLYGLAVSV